MEYSPKERKIARLLSRFPRLKQLVKYTYQTVNYIINKPSQQSILHPSVSMTRIGSPDKGSFFGYYNHSPELEGHILYHQFDIKNVKKRNNCPVDIFVDDEKISETTSWNWQQGSMANWIKPGCIAHNFYDNGYKCKIINLEKKEESVVHSPFYCFFPVGDQFLTLHFTRLARVTPAYGYFNEETKRIPPLDPDDGIMKVDVGTGEKKLIISFKTLTALKSRGCMEHAWHIVNHIDISPDGKRFMFIHRWLTPGGVVYSRLVTADNDGNNLSILADDDMVSHCCWMDNTTIVGWFRKKDLGDHYYIIKDKSGDCSVLNPGLFHEDGHPGFSLNNQWLLTDTYPDKSRMSYLFLYHLKKETLITIGSFFSPLKYFGEYRCDLHPKFSSDNKAVFFDSVHEGTRQLYRIDISSLMTGVS
jgi:hypothetical protein